MLRKIRSYICITCYICNAGYTRNTCYVKLEVRLLTQN